MSAKLKQLGEIAERFMKFGKQTPAKPAPVATPENFEAAKIKGSETSIEYDPTLTVGSLVMESSGTGSIPAPDGKYELDNGIIFNVKDGKIETVEAQATPPVDPNALPPAPTDPAKPAAFEDALKAAIDGLRSEFTAMLKPVQEAYDAVKPVLDTLPTSTELTEFTTHLQNVGTVITELSNISFETDEKKADGLTPEQMREQGFANVGAKFMKTDA